MNTIEIDFDVFKKLTSMRDTETTTYNDVLRRLLGLSSSGQIKPQQADAGAWTTKGVIFPSGTEFRASHKGSDVYGKVEKGALVVDGKRYDSPSSAAVAITGTSVNGWVFWYCKMPGKNSWQILKSFRK